MRPVCFRLSDEQCRVPPSNARVRGSRGAVGGREAVPGQAAMANGHVVVDQRSAFVVGRREAMIVLARLVDQKVCKVLHRFDRVGSMVDAAFVGVPRENRPLWMPLDAVDWVLPGFHGRDERLALPVAVRGQHPEEQREALVSGVRRRQHAVMVEVARDVLRGHPPENVRRHPAQQARGGRGPRGLQRQRQPLRVVGGRLQHRRVARRHEDGERLYAHAGAPKRNVGSCAIGRNRQIEQKRCRVQILRGAARSRVPDVHLAAREEHGVDRVERLLQGLIRRVVQDGDHSPSCPLDVLRVQGEEARATHDHVRTTVRRPLWHRHARTPQTGHRQHAHDRTGGHGPAGEQQRQQQRPPRRPPALRHGPASAPVSGSSRAEGGPTWKTEAA
ncbi:unnamed protein product [Prorocentrum cordatum]|uniref:Uncharacterized protein n=1 Tax=Prorocentrum cordatum TaxID=2364126 RepID=A0ABN9Y329_9DINO|nr:unnamed protein product [Polarella glacialis]